MVGQALRQGITKGLYKDVNPLILFLMVFGSFLLWELNVPFMKKYDVQPELYKDIGEYVSDELVKDIEELILKMIRK